MHMHGLSSHILYKVNAHTMMSSQNLSVPDFMSSGKTPGVHPSRKEFSHADKPGMAHGTRPDRNLYPLRHSSGGAFLRPL